MDALWTQSAHNSANMEIERELPLIQRGIVDNCFEEGQYEYGIDILDKLRAFRYKPSPLHIRQLIFISLYPPPQTPSKHANRADAVPQPSPQKVQLQRQKDDLWPNPRSRPLSIALLNALAITNSPESLLRGLPYHSYVDSQGKGDVVSFQGDETIESGVEDNSPLKMEALNLKQQKDCWDLLRGGLVKRKQADRNRHELSTETPADDVNVVGPYAWPVLEWLIQVFEKDERRTEGLGEVPYSALLLCQIPSPRSKNGPRWDAETPVKVACACMLPDPHAPELYHTSYEKRFDLGTRLILLLTNLTLTKPPLLSPSHFLRSLVVRLQELQLSSLEVLFTAIPLSKASFKVALMESYISQESVPDTINSRQMTSSKVPAPRVIPKFNGKGAFKSEVTAASGGPAVTQDKEKAAYPMSTPDNILNLLASFLPSPPIAKNIDSIYPTLPSRFLATKISLAKFQLVSTLVTLHLSGGSENKDLRWMTASRTGILRKSVQSGFTFSNRQLGDSKEDGMIKDYLSQALELIGLWEAFCEKS